MAGGNRAIELDPAEVAPAAWAADPDARVMPDAGEDPFPLPA